MLSPYVDVYSRNTNNKTNLLNERALRLVYSDYELPFEKLLAKVGSFTVRLLIILRHCALNYNTKYILT